MSDISPARNFLNNAKVSQQDFLELTDFLLWLKPPHQLFITKNPSSSETMLNWYSFCREVFVDDAIRSSVRKIGSQVVSSRSMNPNLKKEVQPRQEFPTSLG